MAGTSEELVAPAENMHEAGYWDLTPHVRSVLAEVAVAEAMHTFNEDTILLAPRTPLVDVKSSGLGLAVDVKVARLVSQHIGPDGPENVIEWNGGRRSGEQAREGVTHFALVVLGEGSQLHLTDGDNGQTHFTGAVKPEAIYLIEREVVNTARRVWNKTASREGTGDYLHLPHAVCDLYRFPENYDLSSEGGLVLRAAPSQ